MSSKSTFLAFHEVYPDILSKLYPATPVAFLNLFTLLYDTSLVTL